MNYAKEPSPAALERASQDVYDVIALTRAARRLCGQLTMWRVRSNEYSKRFMQPVVRMETSAAKIQPTVTADSDGQYCRPPVSARVSQQARSMRSDC